MMFRDKNADTLATAKRAVDQGVERTVNNIEWTNTYIPVIEQWLEDQGFVSKLKSA